MANYFKGAKEFTINGGTFGEDYSRHNSYHGPVYRTNDYSKRTTNYGGYVNHGQHAANGGTINNLGPQTTNNGPINGYRQYVGSRAGNRPSPRPQSPPDLHDGFDAPPMPSSRSGQQSRRRYPPQDPDPRYGRDSDNMNDIDDDDDDDESSDEGEPTPPRHRAQPPPPQRRSQPERSGNLDDSLAEELGKLSPEMQRYVKKMMKQRNPPPVQPERDLQDHMASMQLDDAESSRPPAGRSSPRARPQNPPRRPQARSTNRPPARVADEQSTDEESDEDSVPYGRASITSTESHNVNSTTVVDSHNDNSTKTEISKGYNPR